MRAKPLPTLSFVTGSYMALLGLLTMLRGVGLLEKDVYRYWVPSLGLLTGLTLLNVLRAKRGDGLSPGAVFRVADRQLRPFLWVSIILVTASMVAVIGFAVRLTWFDAATLIALLGIGVLFMTQSRSGDPALARTSSRAAGLSFIVGVLVHAGATFYNQWYTLLTVATGISFVACAAMFIVSGVSHAAAKVRC